MAACHGDHGDVEDEPQIDWEAMDLMLMILMRIDAKLSRLLGEENDGEEEADS
jgi:hypothetical protein